MRRSDQYLRWIQEADKLFLFQKRVLQGQMLVGDFHCLLELEAPDKRRRDGDNYFKAPLDFATKMGLIKDDSFSRKGTYVWVADLPWGCRLTLWDAE